jgi:Leucine-rich repeat (LRR) protein
MASSVALFANGFTSDGKRPPAADRQAKVTRERVRGQWRHPDEEILRITGKVKVKDANTLVFDDGTEVDVGGGMDAPDLEQKGHIGESFYFCGKDAAEFLKKLIGDQTVTFFAGRDQDRDAKRMRGHSFICETSLEIEMIRNGWAISDHSGTIAWEIIARENKRGLWRGKFIEPEQWRKGDRLPGEEDSAAEEKAAAALQEFGAKTKIEDGHVVSLYLQSDKIADSTLEHLKKLPHLRSLSLAEQGNDPKITNAGLAQLAGLTKLKSLHLARLNGTTDAGLVHLKGLTTLENLEITHTKSIDGSGLVHLRELRRLESLNFNHTPVTDDTLEHVKDFTKLKSLGLRATKITDAGLKHLQALENLEQLNLWETNITDDGLARVAKMPQIKHLLLVAAEITADGLKHLENMPFLEDLELRHVKGDDDVVLEHVGRMAHLKRLEFHDIKASESGLKHLGKLTNLEVLLISGSRIPDAGFAHLKGLTGLKNLNLSKVPITDDGLAHLKGLTALEELHLTETKVTDAGLAYLKGMTNLQTLGLMETQVRDAGLEQLAGLTKLRNVSLLHTRVTDEGVKKLKEALPKLEVYYR